MCRGDSHTADTLCHLRSVTLKPGPAHSPSQPSAWALPFAALAVRPLSLTATIGHSPAGLEPGTFQPMQARGFSATQGTARAREGPFLLSSPGEAPWQGTRRGAPQSQLPPEITSRVGHAAQATLGTQRRAGGAEHNEPDPERQPSRGSCWTGKEQKP